MSCGADHPPELSGLAACYACRGTLADKPKKNKYNAKRTLGCITCGAAQPDGSNRATCWACGGAPLEKFDSADELAFYAGLLARQKRGEIDTIQRQVPYPIDVNGARVCKIVVDFTWIERPSGRAVVGEFKSPATMTPVWRLKAKLLAATHGVKVEVFHA